MASAHPSYIRHSARLRFGAADWRVRAGGIRLQLGSDPCARLACCFLPSKLRIAAGGPAHFGAGVMTHAAILIFILYGPGDGLDAAEHGEVIARSCAAAEQWVRGAMRDGQTLQVLSCEPYQQREARR